MSNFKDIFETSLLNWLDFSSDNSPNRQKFSYLNRDINESSDSVLMLDIYLSLNEMFDITLDQINKINSKYQLTNQVLTDKQYQSILEFYDFKNLIDLKSVKNEYLKFFDTFLNKVIKELSDLDVNLNESLYQTKILKRSLLDPDVKLKKKFIQYVYENNNMKYCPVVSILATIYLSLPSVLDFKEPLSLNDVKKQVFYSNLELMAMENKFKLLDSFEHDNNTEFDTLIKFEDIPYFDNLN